MRSLSISVFSAAALAVLGLAACKTVYSDTFSYRKNSFQPPPTTITEIKPPTPALNPLDPGAPGGIPPAVPGGIPEVPGGAVPAAPVVPPAPAPGIPGI